MPSTRLISVSCLVSRTPLEHIEPWPGTPRWLSHHLPVLLPTQVSWLLELNELDVRESVAQIVNRVMTIEIGWTTLKTGTKCA